MKRIIQGLMLVLSVGLVTFALGRKAGARADMLKEVAIAKKHNADSIRLAEKEREIKRRETNVALREAAARRATYAADARRVNVVTDSTVSIDRSPPIFVGIPVVSQLRSGAALARADSQATVRLQAELKTCGTQNQLYLGRIRLLEQENALLKPGRCGFRCGVATTLGVLAAVAFVVQ